MDINRLMKCNRESRNRATHFGQKICYKYVNSIQCEKESVFSQPYIKISQDGFQT